MENILFINLVSFIKKNFIDKEKSGNCHKSRITYKNLKSMYTTALCRNFA